MGLFKKEHCQICGNGIGLISTVKLKDGKVCKTCFNKKSVWAFRNYKEYTVDELKRHLQHREFNAKQLLKFTPTREIGRLYVDEKNMQFAVVCALDGNYLKEQVDVFSFSDVLNVNTSIKKEQIEIKVVDEELNCYSFNPPCYAIRYYFIVRFDINNEFIKRVEFALNREAVDNGQSIRINIHGKAVAKSVAQEPYSEYRGKRSNENDVTNSDDYKKYSEYLKQVENLFSVKKETADKTENDKEKELDSSLDSMISDNLIANAFIKERNKIASDDSNLFLAKLALMTYIANADGKTEEELSEIEGVLDSEGGIYGDDVIEEAHKIMNFKSKSFAVVEPYFRRISDADLSNFLIYSEELACLDDDYSNAEKLAVDRVKSYIQNRQIQKNAVGCIDLKCPGCGGGLKADSYGYKAVCGHCGFEMIMNTENAPEKLNAKPPEIIIRKETITKVIKEEEKPQKQQKPQVIYEVPDRNSRKIEFVVIRPTDSVKFYLNDDFVGADNYGNPIVKYMPKKAGNVAMSYGPGYGKRGSILIPNDDYEYQIFGGRPDRVIYKLYAFPRSMFESYLTAAYNDIMSSRIKRWINRNVNNGCRINIFYDHYEFYYAGNRVEKVKFSSQTKSMAKQIPIRVKEWDKRGYTFCIKRILYTRIQDAVGYEIDFDGTVLKH